MGCDLSPQYLQNSSYKPAHIYIISKKKNVFFVFFITQLKKSQVETV